jgi:hypothetical protein
VVEGIVILKLSHRDDEGKCAFHAAQLLSLPFLPTSTTSFVCNRNNNARKYHDHS